jgi:hypothetical protein
MDIVSIYTISNFFSCMRDVAVFERIRNPGHCLHQLLPAERDVPRLLGPRRHNYVLPTCKYKLNRNSVSKIKEISKEH